MTQVLFQIHPVKTRISHRCSQCDQLIPEHSRIMAQTVPATNALYQTGNVYTRYYCNSCMEVPK